MNKKLLHFLGAVLCAFGIYSCQKDIKSSNGVEESLSAAGGIRPGPTSAFWDLGGLISNSQHGILDTLARGYKFTEGPAVDKEGNVFFTDQPDDRIYKYDVATRQTSLFLEGTGRSNGMAFDKDGNLIACADMHGELWKIHPDGSHEVLVDNYNGHKLNGPNDVWINPATGGMYITDPMFPRGYWDASDPRKINNDPTHNPPYGWPPIWSDQGPGIAGHVYYLEPGSHTLVRVTTMGSWAPNNNFPNGVVGTPDGKKLYVNNWTGDATGKIWSFNINADGSLSSMQTVISGLSGSDGMSMDELGNIYVSSGSGLNAYDPKAKKNILTIPTGGGATNNVFAGKNNKLLIITGGGLTSPAWPNNQDRLTAVQMNVKGVEKY